MKNMDEKRSIEKVQQHLAGIKRTCEKQMHHWMKEGERLNENDPQREQNAIIANGWYTLLADTHKLHASATENLLRTYPGFHNVVLKGGGGR